MIPDTLHSTLPTSSQLSLAPGRRGSSGHVKGRGKGSASSASATHTGATKTSSSSRNGGKSGRDTFWNNTIDGNLHKFQEESAETMNQFMKETSRAATAGVASKTIEDDENDDMLLMQLNHGGVGKKKAKAIRKKKAEALKQKKKKQQREERREKRRQQEEKEQKEQEREKQALLTFNNQLFVFEPAIIRVMGSLASVSYPGGTHQPFVQHLKKHAISSSDADPEHLCACSYSNVDNDVMTMCLIDAIVR